MAQRIQLRRDTAAAWTLANPTLAEGEFGVTTDGADAGKFKVGDGATAWTGLSYIEGTGGGGGTIPDFTGPALLGNSEVGVSGPYETLDPDTVQAMLNYALLSSDDVDEITLATVGAEVSDHIAYTGDDAGTVHGLTPPSVLQANVITQRYQLYENPTTPVTTVVGGFAPAGEVEIWKISTGVNKGLYYRDEDTTAQRLAPLTEYDPEQGYDPVTSNFTSTNTGAITSGAISGLSITVSGRGRPVMVELYLPSARHSVADTVVTAGVIVDGTAGQTGGVSSPDTAVPGKSLYVAHRVVLVDAQSYTFTAGVSSAAAGTASFVASAASPAWLAVSER